MTLAEGLGPRLSWALRLEPLGFDEQMEATASDFI